MKTKKFICVVLNGKYEKIIDVEKQLSKKREYFINKKTSKVFWRELFVDEISKTHYVGSFKSQSNNLAELLQEGDLVRIEKDKKIIIREVVKEKDELLIEGTSLALSKAKIVDVLRSYQKGKYVSLL